MIRLLTLALVGLALAVSSLGAVRAAELVMFERQGCPYCAAWNREIAPIYPKTAEGQRFPLRRVDIHAERPEDLRPLGPIALTPTFVVLDQGREVGRIQGYPGDDMFWGLLDQIIAKLPQ